MNTVVFGIAVYILLQLLIGVWLSKRIVNEADYLLAGRSQGWPLATLSVFATWFGAETCIGAAGAVYDRGLSGATIEPFGYASCLIVMGLVFAIPICGSVLSQELIARTLPSRPPHIAQRACIGGGLLYLMVGLIPVMIGLTGGQLLPGLNEPEQILPQLAQHYLPTFLYIIFAGALISAILSTVDSALLAASAVCTASLRVASLCDVFIAFGETLTEKFFNLEECA